MRVRDAETGEWLEVDVEVEVADEAPRSPARYAAAGMYSPHSLSSPSPILHAETQSTRTLGAQVGWEAKMEAMRARYAAAERESRRGLLERLADPSLSPSSRSDLQVQLLEKMKAALQTHLAALVAEELERDTGRQLAMLADVSRQGRDRLRQQHARERAYYKTLIEQTKEEANLLLTATMNDFNLLR
ncbi:hypothetical protein SPRG_14122 [Saprolegnia parasitica CBS 223.65]|uniref:Uncharacterized protein n=1 Tax=Saprolegnia parasitica (strain CBS 223.65) TaxID=695850 RepID=A0A067C2W1_SAPPC|nr:hypothetical protein SPRG_14122 [Saprolegnia parasitica CBS 223.65]KDO20891.1 hypothetical protein SPRG_14122 [Saprolegnia parasitica CBS 223.65]|eukprot:XP_012208380.1 hypothetical protein SPRG_14122 [Saprolegnia parasitica CBS 223.65]